MTTSPNTELSRWVQRVPGVPSIALDLSAPEAHTFDALRTHGWRVIAVRYGAASAMLAPSTDDAGVHMVRADGRRLPLASRGISLITVWDTLHTVDGELRALGEMHRVLQPGGVLLLALPRTQRRYSRRSLRTLTESVGFTIDKIARTLRGRMILRAHRSRG